MTTEKRHNGKISLLMMLGVGIMAAVFFLSGNYHVSVAALIVGGGLLVAAIIRSAVEYSRLPESEKKALREEMEKGYGSELTDIHNPDYRVGVGLGLSERRFL